MDSKKKLVGAVVAVVLAALAYWCGPDVVSAVKDSMSSEPAPVVSEPAPVVSEPASQPTGE